MQTNEWIIHKKPYEQTTILNDIAATLREGEVVAFPTETVYGLGADATNASAVAKIFEAKGRPQDNPLIAHVANKDELQKYVRSYPAYVDQLIDAFSPGPITYILPSNGVCAANVTAGLDTIGVRIPSHPVARAILQTCGFPVAAPSANISGKPSPTTAEHVQGDLSGKIAGIVDGGQTGVGMESTIVDCTTETPVILRPGGVTKEHIYALLGNIDIHTPTKDPKIRPQAPGMKYTHYAPSVPLVLVKGSEKKMQGVIDTYMEKGDRVGVLARNSLKEQIYAQQFIGLGEELDEIARNLYSCLRAFSAQEIDVIVCESFCSEGLGMAIMNRLEKAATTIIE